MTGTDFGILVLFLWFILFAVLVVPMMLQAGRISEEEREQDIVDEIFDGISKEDYSKPLGWTTDEYNEWRKTHPPDWL